MPSNLLYGFREFVAKDNDSDQEKPDAYLSTVKKQFKIPKKLWLGMPILLSNTKIGKHKITSPTMFYVKEFDDSSVTLTNVLDVGQPEDPNDESDMDDEIDLDKGDVHGRIEVTISREDFDNLSMPQTYAGLDATSLRPPGSGGL